MEQTQVHTLVGKQQSAHGRPPSMEKKTTETRNGRNPSKNSALSPTLAGSSVSII